MTNVVYIFFLVYVIWLSVEMMGLSVVLIVIIFVIIVVTTNGQCPIDLGNSILSSCEGMIKHGPAVYVDFYKINRPCNCILTSTFDGELLLSSRSAIYYECNTEVIVQKILIFRCPLSRSVFDVINVNINQSVDIRANYTISNTGGTFFDCIGFQQNGGLNGNLSVACGSQLAVETSTMKISTTTALSTTRHWGHSSTILSLEPTSEINRTIANITPNAFAANSSEESICAESLDNVSLQISLATFVVISTISAISNIYFIIKIILRNKSRTKNDTTNVVLNHQRGNQSNTGIYTELGNTVSGESDSQYDALSCQHNYSNTNVV